MRFLLIALLSLVGCSDYQMVPDKYDTAEMVEELQEHLDDTPSDPIDGDEELDSDDLPDTESEEDTAGGAETDPEPTEDPCATTQVISTGLWDDTDGDGDRELRYAEVVAKPIFSHLGENAMEVAQGEVSPFDLVITNQCSPIRILNLFYLVDDDDLNGVGWLYEVNDGRVEAGYLSEYSTEIEFDPIVAINLDWGTDADELHYEWCADGVGSSTCTDMSAAREIGADATELYPFEFTATDYAPVGTVYQQMIVQAVWQDLATGEIIWDSIYDIVDVTVVE